CLLWKCVPFRAQNSPGLGPRILAHLVGIHRSHGQQTYVDPVRLAWTHDWDAIMQLTLNQLVEVCTAYPWLYANVAAHCLLMVLWRWLIRSNRFLKPFWLIVVIALSVVMLVI